MSEVICFQALLDLCSLEGDSIYPPDFPGAISVVVPLRLHPELDGETRQR